MKIAIAISVESSLIWDLQLNIYVTEVLTGNIRGLKETYLMIVLG